MSDQARKLGWSRKLLPLSGCAGRTLTRAPPGAARSVPSCRVRPGWGCSLVPGALLRPAGLPPYGGPGSSGAHYGAPLLARRGPRRFGPRPRCGSGALLATSGGRPYGRPPSGLRRPPAVRRARPPRGPPQGSLDAFCRAWFCGGPLPPRALPGQLLRLEPGGRLMPGGGGGASPAPGWVIFRPCPPLHSPAPPPQPGTMGLGASFAAAVIVRASPPFPPAPSPRWGEGGREAGEGLLPCSPRPSALLCIGSWARGAGGQGWGQVLPLTWERPARGARKPPTAGFRGYQLRYQKLGLDKPERTCYYVHARLVSALRGPAFWQSMTLGKRSRSSERLLFFASEAVS